LAPPPSRPSNGGRGRAKNGPGAPPAWHHHHPEDHAHVCVCVPFHSPGGRSRARAPATPRQGGRVLKRDLPAASRGSGTSLSPISALFPSTRDRPFRHAPLALSRSDTADGNEGASLYPAHCLLWEWGGLKATHAGAPFLCAPLPPPLHPPLQPPPLPSPSFFFFFFFTQSASRPTPPASSTPPPSPSSPAPPSAAIPPAPRTRRPRTSPWPTRPPCPAWNCPARPSASGGPCPRARARCGT